MIAASAPRPVPGSSKLLMRAAKKHAPTYSVPGEAAGLYRQAGKSQSCMPFFDPKGEHDIDQPIGVSNTRAALGVRYAINWRRTHSELLGLEKMD